MKELETTLLEFGKGDSKIIIRADAVVAIENAEGKAFIVTTRSDHTPDESYETARNKWRKALEELDASV